MSNLSNPSMEPPFFVAAEELCHSCGVLVNDIERNLAAVFGAFPADGEAPKPPEPLAHQHLNRLENLKTRLTQVAQRLDCLTGDGQKQAMAAETVKRW